MGKGGSKTQTVTNETKLPQWVDKAGQANYQMAQQIAGRPYQPYTGNMLAGWNQGQQQAYNSVLNGAGTAGLGAMNAAQQGAAAALNYQPQQVAGQSYNPAMQGVMNTPAASAGSATPWTVMNTHGHSAGPAAQMNASQAELAQMQAAQMDRGSVRDVAAKNFLNYDINKYMNPYIGTVVNNSLADLSRQNDIVNNTTNARAAAAGAFGGSRQAVANTLNNENYLRESGNLSGKLRQAGYDTASGLIMQDANRDLTAQQSNQQMDFGVGSLNANLGQQAGLQNMLAANQTSQYNAGNRQQAGQLNQAATNNMAQYNASNAMRAGELTSAAHNAAAQQQAMNANQMAQYNASNQQSAYNSTAQAHNAALANQAAALNAAGQFNSNAALQAALANQTAGLNATNSRLSAANALSGMGAAEQQQLLRAAEAQFAMGQNRTAFDQAALSNAYNQWAAERDYPLQQLNILQSGLTQTPYGKTSAEVSPYYQNTGANMLSGALGGAMAGNMLGGGLAGWTGVGGGVGAALGLLCWVARAAYGADNPRWLDFREWMVREAPVPLYRAYLRHGPAFARFIADKPGLRRVVRGLMERVLRAYRPSQRLGPRGR